MQAPFWKVDNEQREALISDFVAIIEACGAVGIGFLVVPLVDGGSLENMAQENILVSFLREHESRLRTLNIEIVFESDFPPTELKRFISRLDEDRFGINYDIGNSFRRLVNVFVMFI